MASRMLSNASSSVAPWDQQPGESRNRDAEAYRKRMKAYRRNHSLQIAPIAALRQRLLAQVLRAFQVRVPLLAWGAAPAYSRGVSRMRVIQHTRFSTHPSTSWPLHGPQPLNGRRALLMWTRRAAQTLQARYGPPTGRRVRTRRG